MPSAVNVHGQLKEDSEGMWQYGGVVDFECFQVWLFNLSSI